MTRISRLLLLSLSLLAACRSDPRQPDVVFVVIDTLRADHVGAYGSGLGLTPNIDRLAAKGVTFDAAVATSSWTRSSVASMLTSRYAGAIGVLGREDAVSDDLTTLPEILRDHGYTTLGVSANSNAGRPFGFAQGFDRFEIPRLTAGYEGDVLIHTAEGITRRALELIDETKGDAPIFLFLHYVDPHDPYLPHPGLLAEPEPPGRFDGSRRSLDRMDRARARELAEADRARIRYLYRGEVKYCDIWLGELLDALAKRRIGDDALILITSDHGEGLWDHGFRGHGRDLFEEMVRVPLVMTFPQGTSGAQSRIVDAPVSLRDLAPTILDVAGVPLPADFEGSSLLPLLASAGRPLNAEAVFAELELDHRSLVVVRRGPFKLIEDLRAPPGPASQSYFDLRADPSEQGDAPVPPSDATELNALLDAWRSSLAADAKPRTRVNADALTEDTLDNLRALGYLGGGDSAATALASIIDFSDEEHPEEQLLRGFYETESGRRWMAARATALLGRSPELSDWQIEGWLDLGLLGVDAVTLGIGVDDSPTVERTIRSSGFFLLHGPLPAHALPEVRLHISCDRDFVPQARQGTADERRLCAVIRSIALR